MTALSRSRSGRRLFVGGVVSMVASVAIVAGLLARKVSLVRAEGRARAADVAAGPHVRVVRVTAPQGVQTLTLLGEARPYAAVTLYAKVSGYLRQMLVDKGDAVGAGQVLAVIESAELDQQYEATLADARNKRVNAGRFRALAKQNASSAQEAERYETDAAVAEANLKAIETLKSYEVIRAPFTGRVTARYADPGALVQNATNAQTGALPVLTVSETGRLRVYAYVDQQDAPLVRVGTPAEITVPDRPEVRLASRLTPVRGVLAEVVPLAIDALPALSLGAALERAARRDPADVSALGHVDIAAGARRAAGLAFILPALEVGGDVTGYPAHVPNPGTGLPGTS